MDGQLTVELADLRGWARQVGRAGDDCGYLADYVTSFVPDGDFGPILAPIRTDYERFVARVREVLPVDAAGLVDTQAALRLAATRYAQTDARVAQGFGVSGDAIVDDGHVSPGLGDTGATRPDPPVCGGEALPVVSLTWAFSQVNDLVVAVGGPDMRRELTDFVAGDIGKALAQASVWESSAQALAAIRGNLVHGSRVVGRSWAGEAASSSRAHTEAWVAELGSQSETLAQGAAHLRDAVAQAVDVAQLVADAIQLVITTVLVGLTLPSIPIFGPVQLANKLKDAVRLLWEARKVLAVFWIFLVCIKDAFSTAVDCFAAAALPPAPVVPARLP